jgi:hypothetical protein
MRYRVKYVEAVGYFAQVKRGWFGGWKTIGLHMNNQTGEYAENHLSHPLDTQHEAINLAHVHADFNKARKGFTSYREMAL